ncbi:hypothetical protein [Dysgonomonas sp. 216]|uniref:hypothetical protein n=1 Tax=Dysgonomonas sp. 216 TaxID=2302934 RepID=UPI0013CFF9CA|nr:hypothetical protein [Dysgonomonas sp. 216]
METKFNIGDKIWVIINTVIPVQGVITEINTSSNMYHMYTIAKTSRPYHKERDYIRNIEEQYCFRSIGEICDFIKHYAHATIYMSEEVISHIENKISQKDFDEYVREQLK